MRNEKHIGGRGLILLTLTVFFFTLLMTGCHGSRRTAQRPIPATSAEETSTILQHRTYTVIAFTGEAGGLSVAGQLRVAQDSVMWLSVNKIFEVGRAMATQDSLFLRAPLLGYDIVTTYPDLHQRLKRDINYTDLQTVALSDNAEEQIAALAMQLGFDIKVHITERRQVDHLNFPYPKPMNP